MDEILSLVYPECSLPGKMYTIVFESIVFISCSVMTSDDKQIHFRYFTQTLIKSK